MNSHEDKGFNQPSQIYFILSEINSVQNLRVKSERLLVVAKKAP